MTRYIDADVAKEILSLHEDNKGYLVGDFEQIIDEEVPTADVVERKIGKCISGKCVSGKDVAEVVRCEECKYYGNDRLKRDFTEDKRYKTNTCFKGKYAKHRDPDWFCADGERREDGEVR